jgi:hypothetical protein
MKASGTSLSMTSISPCSDRQTIRNLIAVMAPRAARAVPGRRLEEENIDGLTLNRRAYEHAKELIDEGRLVFDERDDWSERRPSAQEENEFIRLSRLFRIRQMVIGNQRRKA